MTAEAEPRPGTEAELDLYATRTGARLSPHERAERAAKAISMSNAGASLKQIAAALEVHPDTVRRDLEFGLQAILQAPAEERVARQLAAMADIRAANYKAMLQGDDKAAAAIIKASEREAKLTGMDAPTKVHVGVSDRQFATTAAALMREIGLVPPDEFIVATPIEAAIEGPPAANAAVDAEIVAIDDEPDLADEWVI